MRCAALEDKQQLQCPAGYAYCDPTDPSVTVAGRPRSSGSDNSDDLKIALPIFFLLILPLCVAGAYFGYRRYRQRVPKEVDDEPYDESEGGGGFSPPGLAPAPAPAPASTMLRGGGGGGGGGGGAIDFAAMPPSFFDRGDDEW